MTRRDYMTLGELGLFCAVLGRRVDPDTAILLVTDQGAELAGSISFGAVLVGGRLMDSGLELGPGPVISISAVSASPMPSPPTDPEEADEDA